MALFENLRKTVKKKKGKAKSKQRKRRAKRKRRRERLGEIRSGVAEFGEDLAELGGATRTGEAVAGVAKGAEKVGSGAATVGKGAVRAGEAIDESFGGDSLGLESALREGQVNVSDLKKELSFITSRRQLDSLANAERAGKGRPTALSAIRQRRAELKDEGGDDAGFFGLAPPDEPMFGGGGSDAGEPMFEGEFAFEDDDSFEVAPPDDDFF